MGRVLAAVIFATVFIAAGCASSAPHYNFNVATTPPGAEVYLQRHGQRVVEGGVMGIGGGGNTGEAVSDPEFRFLNNSPVHENIELEETESAINTPIGGSSARRVYSEGVVRIVMPGYVTVERRVRLGDVDINIPLQPSGGPPPAQNPPAGGGPRK